MTERRVAASSVAWGWLAGGLIQSLAPFGRFEFVAYLSDRVDEDRIVGIGFDLVSQGRYERSMLRGPT